MRIRLRPRRPAGGCSHPLHVPLACRLRPHPPLHHPAGAADAGAAVDAAAASARRSDVPGQQHDAAAAAVTEAPAAAGAPPRELHALAEALTRVAGVLEAVHGRPEGHREGRDLILIRVPATHTNLCAARIPGNLR